MSERYEVRFKKVRLNGLENRLVGLEENFEALSKQIGYTSNLAERNNLERQLAEVEKEMERIAKECAVLEREISELVKTKGIKLLDESDETKETVQFLCDRLAPHESEIKTQLENAHQLARPTDWQSPLPKTLKGLLLDLGNMQLDEHGYSPLFKFVAGLVVDAQIQEKHWLCQELQEWAEQNSQNFATVLEYVRQFSGVSFSPDEQQIHSYLTVVIEQSKTADQQKEPCYFVKAWFILDGQNYQPGKAAGFETLTIPGALEDAENAFTMNEVQELLKAFLQESGRKCLSRGRLLENLTIELFLPSDLLNHAADGWVMEEIDDEFSMSEPLGFQHRLLVRSSERLRSNYFLKRGASWRDKWKQVRQKMQERSPQEMESNGFVSGDGVAVKTLFQQLSQPQMIGLKLAQGPLSIGKESMFAALQASATPIAVWVRQPLAIDCVNAVDQLLGCCLHEIPERVKQHRRSAFSIAQDGHIGHHLSLLWEDFDRLPPDLDYYMASA